MFLFQMLTLSLYFHQSSVFLAFVLDDIHVKIFVKKDKKWIELRSVVSEVSIARVSNKIEILQNWQYLINFFEMLEVHRLGKISYFFDLAH